MANLPEDKKWTGVYQWETSDRALGGPDSLFTKPTRDLTARTGYLKEQIEKGNEAFTEHEKSTNHPDATIVAKGFVKLSSAVDSTSETLAATPKAVKTTMDKANSAASAASTAQTTANIANSTANTAKTNAATAQFKADSAYSLANKANSTASSAKSTAETDATTSAKGRVQLSSAVDSTSEALAATPKAVKTAMDKANSAASAASTAQTTANIANSTANTAKTNAATAQFKADSAYSLANKANSTASSAKSTAETDASTTVKGRVQLNSAVNSTVENQAATPKAVKTAYDLANAANTKASKSLGVGQTWQDVKSSRATNTVYTNTTGKPIYVYIQVFNNWYLSAAECTLTLGSGVELDAIGGGVGNSGAWKSANLSVIVPENETYKVTTDSNIKTWAELR